MLLGMLFTFTNSSNVSDLQANEAGIQALGALAKMVGASNQIGDLPTAADYQRAVYVDAVFFLVCLIGIVFTFLKSKTVGLAVAGLLGLMAILFYLFQPSLNGAAFQDSNTDKGFALAVAVGAVIGAGLLALLKLKFSDQAYSVIEGTNTAQSES